jgi:hypothetical protein
LGRLGEEKMKRFFAAWIFILLVATQGFAQVSPKPYIIQRASCTDITDTTVICHNTTDGKKYVYNGSAVVELAAGAGSFSVTDITGAADDTTPATTATAVLAQGGSLIESTIAQIIAAVLPTYLGAGKFTALDTIDSTQYVVNRTEETAANGLAIIVVKNNVASLGQFVMSSSANTAAQYGQSQMTFEANGIGGMAFLVSNGDPQYNVLRFLFGNGATPTEAMRIASTTGYVGVATTAPDAPLEVNSATGLGIRVTYNDSNGSAANHGDITVGATGTVTVTATGTNPDVVVTPGGSGQFQVSTITGSTQSLQVDTNGKVSGAQAVGTTATPQFARVGFGQAADATNPASGVGWSFDPDGDLTVKSVTVTKVSGTAGQTTRKEANSTDVDFVGEIAPASMTGDTSYLLRDVSAKPTSDNMTKICDLTGVTGTGTPADPFIVPCSWYDLDGKVSNTLYDANTILYATSDNTPLALTVGASTLVGRKASGDIVALTPSEAVTILAASGCAPTEIDAHTDSSPTAIQLRACNATTVHNYNQAAANVNVTLPTTAANLGFTSTVSTAQAANYWRFTAASAGTIYLNGSATGKDYVQYTTPVAGSYFGCFTANRANSYVWYCSDGVGSLATN